MISYHSRTYAVFVATPYGTLGAVAEVVVIWPESYTLFEPTPLVPRKIWLKRLDDTNQSDDRALNTNPLGDLAGYLKALPPSDNPQTVFDALRATAGKLVTAQNVIDKMLKQQATR